MPEIISKSSFFTKGPFAEILVISQGYPTMAKANAIFLYRNLSSCKGIRFVVLTEERRSRFMMSKNITIHTVPNSVWRQLPYALYLLITKPRLAHLLLSSKPSELGIHVNTPLGKPYAMFHTICKLMAFTSYGLRIVRQKRIHLVDGHWAHLRGIIAFMLAKIMPLGLIVTVYGTEPSLGFFRKHVEATADAIVTNSHYTASKLRRKDITVIYPMIDTETFCPREPLRAKPARIISTLGFISKRKAFDDLVKALYLILQGDPEVSLMIGGEGDVEGLKTLCHALGIEKKIFFKGYVPNEQIVDFFRASDVFVLPSAEEGFGVVVAEAMACGKPVVVTDGGALPEVVGECGIVVPKHNPEALAMALTQLFRDEKTRIELGEMARRRVAALFSSQKIIPQLQNFYLRLLLDCMRRSRVSPSDYTYDYYKFHLKRYLKKDKWSQERIRNVFSLIGKVAKEELILDLGCGIGTFVIEISKRGANVIGTDYSHEATRLSKKLTKRFHVNGEIIRCDSRFLPFKSNIFAKVVGADLIEHLTKHEYLGTVREAHRVLKPYGLLCLYTPNALKVRLVMRLAELPVRVFSIIRRTRNTRELREYRDEELEEFRRSDEKYSKLDVDLKSPLYIHRTLSKMGFKTRIKVKTSSYLDKLPLVGWFCGGRLMVRAIKKTFHEA